MDDSILSRARHAPGPEKENHVRSLLEADGRDAYLREDSIAGEVGEMVFGIGWGELVKHQNQTGHNDCEFRDGRIHCAYPQPELEGELKPEGNPEIHGKKHFESLSTCDDCGADIMFAVYTGTGNPAPIDVEPNQLEGRINVDLHAMTYIILKAPEVERAIERGDNLYTSHMATCPVKKEQREKKAGLRV